MQSDLVIANGRLGVLVNDVPGGYEVYIFATQYSQTFNYKQVHFVDLI